MDRWFSGIEQGLPEWLNRPETQWAQWVYAIWQLIRCNPVTILVLSYLPFTLSQWWRKKEVVVLGESREYTMVPAELDRYFQGGLIKLKNIEEISRHLENDDPNLLTFHIVKHSNYYYFTYIATLCDLLKCTLLFGESIIFVDSLRRISGSLAVGKKLSETEAYEKIFTRRYVCSKGADLVVPTSLDYVDFSSKFWVVISTVPLLLQANNYVKLSTLLSLVLIVIDCNRGRLYRFYDRSFSGIANYVKLNFFRERRGLYHFFSVFSNRWGYSDTVKNCAYEAHPGETINIGYYSKLEKPDDIKIVGWPRYGSDPKDENRFMEIDIDRAHCDLMKYNEPYPEVKLNRHVYIL